MVYATPFLRQLISNDLLPSRLVQLGIKDKKILPWLKSLDRNWSLDIKNGSYKKLFSLLLSYGLISTEAYRCLSEKSRQTIPLPFVTAINMELTYQCNLACSHCLQSGIRDNLNSQWIPTNLAKKSIEQAWFAGFLSSGVNFTGGEIFMPESNLPELLETTKSLNIPVRVNTNGWWGGKKRIKIGERTFSKSIDVIQWLLESKVLFLALSLDSRYVTYPSLWKSVTKIIGECKRIGLSYQLVATGLIDAQLKQKLLNQANKENLLPNDIYFDSMDMVDIGGDFSGDKENLRGSALKNLYFHSPCMNKGFTRPKFLHINPKGGVRTCMYSPGSDFLGNLNESSLFQIINNFSDNPAVELFRQRNMNDFVDKYFTPYLDIYRNIKHPCAIAALLSRFAGEIKKSELDIRNIHKKIAIEYNLSAER